MPIPVPVLVLGAAALGALVVNKINKSSAQAAADAAARQAVLAKAATEFTQGKTYAVQLMVTNTIGTKDIATAAAVIKSTMEQLGWKLISTPALRDGDNTTAFTTGQPAQWVFNGQWTLADKFMKVVPAWLGSAIAFELPVN